MKLKYMNYLSNKQREYPITEDVKVPHKYRIYIDR
jgi:fibrillarin-like rRNA methylase